jgi:NAD+ synthase (glutamine-hydrolysing)
VTRKLRIVMAQLNLLVGDVPGNVEKTLAAAVKSRDELDAQLVVFPELTLTGYPPEDLLFHSEDGRIYNVGAVIGDGKVQAVYRKAELPNYSVFDEKRYFTPGDETTLIDVAGFAVGVNVCEDIWHAGPARRAAAAGAGLIVVPNASPFEIGKQRLREEELRQRVADAKVPFVYVNHVGGQDELVFDGGSLAMNADGTVAMRAPDFEEGLYPVDFTVTDGRTQVVQGSVHVDASQEDSVYRGIVLGVRDYALKNRFQGAVVGLSGGIDSALTLAVAVDALGAGNVTAVMMPSRYTTRLSLDTAAEQAHRMGVTYQTLSIEPAFEALKQSLREPLGGDAGGVTEQNLQARIRGVLLMAISNKTGRLVLTTGNKSEMAVGYATLYGDMAGGFAPLRDVTKTLVYALARYRNGLSPVIPSAVIEREPSAELAPGQKDSDSLPPYAVLDPILTAYVEEDRTVAEIVALGYDEATVRRVVGLIQNAEYKRRQGPPGVRVSRRAFGRDRRYPITSGYR